MFFNEYPNQQIFELKEIIPNDTIVRDITFPTKQDALIYFEDMHKIYMSVAVKYTKPNEDFKNSSSYKELENKLNESIQNYLYFPNNLLKKVSEQKSNLKGCSSCKSSINKDLYVKNTENDLEQQKIKNELNKTTNYNDLLDSTLSLIKCPICGSMDFVITETDTSKLKSLENKIKDCEKKIYDEEITFKLKNGQEIVWIVASKKEL